MFGLSFYWPRTTAFTAAAAKLLSVESEKNNEMGFIPVAR
jgi:hypothetical protein